MDISVLKLFVDVMHQGNFATVARDRNLDPSSVSRAISGLEKELGIRLFQRSTRQLSPTEAGVVYFRRIEPLVEELQEAISIATDLSKQPKGTLRITTSTSFGQTVLVPLLPKFQATYPDLTVELLLTDLVVDLFTEKIDVALRLGQLTDSTLIAQQLMKTHYKVCASPEYLEQYGHPKSPREIEAHNCLLFPLKGFRSKWIFRDQNKNITEVQIQGRTVISNASSLLNCAIAGMGLALLPNWLINPALKDQILIDIFPDYTVTATNFETAIWFVYPSRVYIPLKVKLWVEFLKTSVNKDSIMPNFKAIEQ